MRIVAYHSPEAIESARWLARFEVAVKPPKRGEATPRAQNPEAEIIGGGRPDLVGYLPIVFRGATRDEAVGKAQAHWDRVVADEAAKRESIATRVAKARQARSAA